MQALKERTSADLNKMPIRRHLIQVNTNKHATRLKRVQKKKHTYRGCTTFRRKTLRQIQRQLVYYDSLSNAPQSQLLFLPSFDRKN